MSLIPTDEQKMLEDSVSGLLHELASEPSAILWQGFADMGLLAMPFNEADGGLGSGPDEVRIVSRLLGKEPVAVAFLASAILGGHMLAALATPEQKASLLPGLMQGSATLAFAHSEPQARYRRAHVGVRAERVEGGYRLSGLKSLVLNGASATHLVVSARTGGSGDDAQGISLFLLPSSTPGLRIAAYVATEASLDADVMLDDVFVPASALLGEEGAALPAIEAALDHATVAAVSEAVGAMEELLDLTVDYLKLRKQFGVPIGTFQSLQHKAVDMFIEVEQARSMAIYATGMLTAADNDRRLAVAAAKAHLNAAARFVGEAAVQLHGAIGMTLESKTGRLFRRLTLFQLNFGDRDHCLGLLGAADTSIVEA